MNAVNQNTEIMRVKGHYILLSKDVISELKKYCRLVKVLDPMSSQKVWYIAGKN